jgi:hypothetical protein
MWRPYGTRLIEIILPGTACRAWSLFRPSGTGVTAKSETRTTHLKSGRCSSHGSEWRGAVI